MRSNSIVFRYLGPEGNEVDDNLLQFRTRVMELKGANVSQSFTSLLTSIVWREPRRKCLQRGLGVVAERM